MPYICLVTAYQSADFLGLAAQQLDIDHVMTKPIFKEQMHEVLVKGKISIY